MSEPIHPHVRWQDLWFIKAPAGGDPMFTAGNSDMTNMLEGIRGVRWERDFFEATVGKTVDRPRFDMLVARHRFLDVIFGYEFDPE